MLNYIWAGLIIFSFAFALWQDAKDIRNDVFRNDKPLPVVIQFAEGSDPQAPQRKVKVVIGQESLAAHFGVSGKLAESYDATLIRLEKGMEVRFAKEGSFPAPLSTIRDESNEEKILVAKVNELQPTIDTAATVTLTFSPVRFLKLKAITNAAFDFAKTAVTLALGLIGVLALWLGLMKIAEAAGLIAVFVKLVHPILHPLFPQVPRDHPAMGMIALNLAANMLGLGNAATPFGLKAMEELQKLNPTDDTATDPMVMLLAINTAGVQLLPPATLVALMGFGVAEIFVPMLIVTGIALVVAIISVRLLGTFRGYRQSDPNRMSAATGGH
jgi:spore maturation protein A